MPDTFVRDILIVGITLLSSVILHAWKDWRDRKRKVVEYERTKLENEKLKQETLQISEERLRAEIGDLLKQIKINMGNIAKLKENEEVNREEILRQAKETELCKLQHSIAELELAQLKSHNIFNNWVRKKVFVIDDDPDVMIEFRASISKSSTLDYTGFTNVDIFLDQARAEQPPVVVMDFNLGKMTAGEAIDLLGYQPAVFIMSSEKGYEGKFQGKTNVYFFVKDDHYVFKIVEAIIKYLLETLKTKTHPNHA